jgi:regulator of protease activity HflC (stomatin/prohibitin superfamily)
MDLDEVRKDRRETEEQIKRLLNELADKTGITVDRVSVDMVDVVGSDHFEKTRVTNVNIDLSI